MESATAVELRTVIPPVEPFAPSTFPGTPATELSGYATASVNAASNEDSGALLNESSLPPVDQGFGAWSFLISATILEMVIWGFPVAFGVFLEAYLANPRYSNQKNSQTLLPLIGTLSSGVMFCSGPVVYPLSSRYPQYRRAFLYGGTILCIISLFAASFTDNIVALLALEGLLYAIGGTLRYAPCLSYLAEWFVQRQGLANGLMSAGTATGGLILPLVFPSLMAKVGPEKALRYISIAMAVITLPILRFVDGRLPVSRVYVHGPTPRGSQTRFMNLAKNSTFWMIMAMNFTQSFGYFVPLLYLPTFATDIPLSTTNAAVALALLNGASVFGRILIGVLCDLFSPWLLALAITVAVALTTFLLWGLLATSFSGLAAFAVLYGSIAGGWPSLWTGFTQLIASKDDPLALTTLFGYLMFFRGISNIVSTPISAAFYSHTNPRFMPPYKTGFEVGHGRFEWMITFVGLCYVCAAIVTAMAWIYEKWKKGREIANATEGYQTNP